MSPAASSIYPPENLYDGEAEFPARHGSLAADSYVQVDADALRGSGNMDSWSGGLPGSQWTKTGTVVEDSVIYQAGKSSAKLSIGSLESILECSPGEVLGLDGYLRGDGANAIAMNVKNLQTGKELNAAGAWVSSANCVEVGAAAWTPFSFAPTVESFATHRNDIVQMRVRFSNAAGNGWVDEVTAIPAVDWVSIHGHNLDPLNAVKLRSAPDAAFTAATDRATLTVRPRSFFAWLSAPVVARYWRAPQLVATQNSALSGPPYYGETILGQSLALAGGVDFPVTIAYERAQARPRTGSGREGAYPLSSDVVRTLTLKATYGPRADWDQAYQEVMERTEHGLYPCVMAYDVGAGADGDSDLVIFGRLAPTLSVQRGGLVQRATTFTLQEFPFPPQSLAT